MTSNVQAYAYARPSAVCGGTLGLETSGGLTPAGPAVRPHFFTGFLTRPAAAAAALLAVADVAAARHHRPDLARLRDPVVTAHGDRLRFESFSGCCGVHARLDILGDGLDGGEVLHGTTNVDVNNPLRDALGRVGAGDPMHLRVGPEELAVTTLDGAVVEKKVPLPERWLRGFAETQVISAGFDLRAELDATEAVRFLRSLPRAGRAGRADGTVRWFVPAGRGLRPSSRPTPGAVCLPGPVRLGVLHRVLRHVTGLRLYGPPVEADGAPVAGAWEVLLPGMRLTLLLSPAVARGFSGEGAVLDALAGDEAAADAELIAVLLAWEPRVDPAELAEGSGLSRERVWAALVRLGTAGRVGYDIFEAAYFHRELPYEADRVERHNPRLVSARALVAEGAVTFLDGGGNGGGPDGVTAFDPSGAFTARVRSGERVHLVRSTPGEPVPSCTCRWWADHRGRRGPCKHALAVRIVRRRGAAGVPHPDSTRNPTGSTR
ncbi:SWIM zinc finger family protein [Streptomyces sp. ST2-7A]|uniref:SWIM zinc finger family protein n=1 Tax=Streptomyces sp. ST2-7A TaxID=2907214 RepID=UPI001F32B760|nr:SWIM zinc finger family protein [Streptomyces sp. ST2-7A]MCE7080678.1 SWIM zinc finger domain-containing protein [Streptomyces sp. ST2-7A]